MTVEITKGEQMYIFFIFHILNYNELIYIKLKC